MYFSPVDYHTNEEYSLPLTERESRESNSGPLRKVSPTERRVRFKIKRKRELPQKFKIII